MKLKCPNCKEYFDTQSAVDTTVKSFDPSDLMDWYRENFNEEEKAILNRPVSEEKNDG